MADNNDKKFDAMMSTLFECADMNTEDLEEFADEYLARLRADAAFKKDIVNIATECRRKCPHPISSVHFASVVGHAVLIYMNKQGCGDPYYD